MAAADARMLRIALLLRRFTKKELAVAANVPPETAHSWIKRHREYLIDCVAHSRGKKDSATQTPQAGRPAKTWLVSKEGIEKLKSEIAQFVDTHEYPPFGSNTHLDRLEVLLKEWHEAVRHDDQRHQQEIAASAKIRIRAAWQSYSEMHSLGFAVPEQSLTTLGQLELSFHLGQWSDNTELPAIGSWLAAYLRRMDGKGIDQSFAARVLYARARARGTTIVSQLTTATLGLSTWFDELPDQCLTEDDVRTCRCILDVVPIGVQLEHAFSLLHPTRMPSSRPEQRQAIVLGLASAHPKVEQVTTWLLSLEDRDCWWDELAPAVVYGTAERPYVQQRSVIHSFRDSLKRALNAKVPSCGSAPGRLRARAHEIAAKALHSDFAPTENTSIDQVVGYFSSR